MMTSPEEICVDDTRVSAKSSSVNELLHSNHPPTEFEAILVRDDILEIQGDLEDLSTKTQAATSSLLGRSFEKRQTLQNSLHAHRAVLSPLHRVPVEILAQIFTLCLPPFPSRPSVNDAPLLFERICTRWRDVARSTRILWASITLDLLPGAMEFEMSIARDWPSRAGHYPLLIALGTRRRNCVADWHPAVDFLIPHCERWVEVELALSYEFTKRFRAVKGRLPQLRSLSIGEPLEAKWLVASPVDAFQEAPQLRILKLHDFITMDDLSVPWNSLTKLITHEHWSSNVLEILEESSNLVTCELMGIHHDHYRPSFQLHHLTSLTISTCAYACELWGLRFPSLRRITISITTEDYASWTYYNWSWRDRCPFVKCISRSKCAIESFKLVCSGELCFIEDDARACLEAMPSLTELEIRSGSPSATAADAMNPLRRLGSLGLVPKLQTLTIAGPHEILPDELFADMVNQRWTQGLDIRAIKIVVNDEYCEIEEMPKTLAAVRACRAQGGMIMVKEDEEGNRADASVFWM